LGAKDAEIVFTASGTEANNLAIFGHALSKDRYKNGEILAEDLGVYGHDVVDLLNSTGFAQMRVIQFAFDETRDSVHLPQNYPVNSIAYVGTHDNNTMLGWLYEATPEERDFALKYCGFRDDNWGEGGYYSKSCRAFIEAVWKSPARYAVVAIQDMCGFGSDTRMNTPGVEELNWRYRATKETLDSIDTAYFAEINDIFGRICD
jgi:4-alpha-glucanotransferase